MHLSRLLLLLACTAFFVGCAKKDPHAGHNHGGGHAHTAPHGGLLVEIGDHAYNLEFVRDAAAGKLTAYVLDGHAENFVRIPATEFEVIAVVGGERKTLALKAVANAATGETVGSTSQFEATADWLKSAGDIPGTVSAVEIKGTRFQNVAFYLKK